MNVKSKRRYAGGVAILAGVLMAAWSCQWRSSTPPPQTAPAETPADTGPPLFVDMTPDTGIQFTYRNGQEAGHFAILESLGGGVGLIDYDGDGLLDIFVTGGGFYEGPDKKIISGYPCKLYKNLGNWKFKDVTREVGLDRPLMYSHGCAVADYDCDGWPDLLVTGWGRLALYHNESDGKGGRRFVDVTAKSGLDRDHLWSSSAAWADLDGDGYPDLYVAHYVNWSLDNNPRCYYHDSSIQDVCPPRDFKPLPHVLFRNNRDGTFGDVSKAAGLFQKTVLDNSKGLGVIAADITEDGRTDIYVCDDTTDNLFYINRTEPGKPIKLEEVGLQTGTARDERGVPNGSMGVAVADYNGSGRPSIWVANYQNENHALYRNDGKELFTYATQAAGIAALGQLYVGFGTGFIDVDRDGWEDIVIANGHVIRHPRGADLEQLPVLMRNKGNGFFKNITSQGGPYFGARHIGRGMALGDLDNDGKIDLVISHLNEPIAVLRGQGGADNHWLGVELMAKDHRDIVGARVTLQVEGRTLTRFVVGGGSYLSASDPRRFFGLGQSTRAGTLTVKWPSGEPRIQTWDNLPVDRYHRLLQGQAHPQPARETKPEPVSKK